MGEEAVSSPLSSHPRKRGAHPSPPRLGGRPDVACCLRVIRRVADLCDYRSHDRHRRAVGVLAAEHHVLEFDTYRVTDLAPGQLNPPNSPVPATNHRDRGGHSPDACGCGAEATLRTPHVGYVSGGVQGERGLSPSARCSDVRPVEPCRLPIGSIELSRGKAEAKLLNCSSRAGGRGEILKGIAQPRKAPDLARAAGAIGRVGGASAGRSDQGPQRPPAGGPCPDSASRTASGEICSACGSEFALAGPLPLEVRKTVTVLFCDVTGLTTLGERQDPERVSRVMTRYFDEAHRRSSGTGASREVHRRRGDGGVRGP